jgi:antitoxin component of MazEF toxin-antitoxin module
MLRRKITTSGNSAALVLSQDVLGLMGVGVGDEVELELLDRTLVVRPAAEVEERKKVAAAMDDVLRRRAGLLTRLARHDGTPRPKPKR